MTKSRARSRGSNGRKGGGPTPLSAGKAESRSSTRPSETQDEDKDNERQQLALPFALQQRLLDVFSRALATTLDAPRLPDALQAVKRALFARDFAAAFGGEGEDAVDGQPPLLEAYAARWSPTRALCYTAILGSPIVQEHWPSLPQQHEHEHGHDQHPPHRRMIALGGAAAELVAFAGLLDLSDDAPDTTNALTLVDTAPWTSVVEKLLNALRSPPNTAIVSPRHRLAVSVRQCDVLLLDEPTLRGLLVPSPSSSGLPPLVALFFTLNELFTAGGLGCTATFLLRLTTVAPSRTALLVVDSPGSYAETAVGADKTRRYPMHWLLDKILLQDAAAAWRKIHHDPAVWFRRPQALIYPIRLEDMRYQVHLFVRR